MIGSGIRIWEGGGVTKGVEILFARKSCTSLQIVYTGKCLLCLDSCRSNLRKGKICYNTKTKLMYLRHRSMILNKSVIFEPPFHTPNIWTMLLICIVAYPGIKVRLYLYHWDPNSKGITVAQCIASPSFHWWFCSVANCAIWLVFAGKPGNEGTLLGLQGWRDQTAVS